MKDPDYIEWIKSQPCLVEYCRGRPCDAHHRIGHGRNTDIKPKTGLGILMEATRTRTRKTCDFQSMPLCTAHHTEIHAIGWREFEAVYHIHQLKVGLAMQTKYILYQRVMKECPI